MELAWIAVEDRLPEPGVNVAVFWPGRDDNYAPVWELGCPGTAFYRDGRWFDPCGGEKWRREPTHWTPLPAAPVSEPDSRPSAPLLR